MLAREFFKQMLVKAGLNPEDQQFKPHFDALSAELDLPDSLAAAVNNGLLSMRDAMNNHPQIGGHYRSQVYNGLDSELNSFIQTADLDEATVNEINAEKSSTKRAVLIASKIRELTERKSTTNVKGEKDQLNQQIVSLNADLRKLKDEIAGKDTAHAEALRQQQVNFKKGILLQQYKTIHDGMEPGTRDAVLNVVLEQHLRAKNAKLTVDANGELEITGADGANVFGPDNRAFTAKAFVDSVFAQEKFLVVADGNNQNNPGPNGQHNNSGHNRQHSNNQNQNYNQNQNQNQNGNGNGNGNNGGRGSNSSLMGLVKEAQGYQSPSK